MATHYDVLGVRSDATTAEIRRAYVDRARELHPDSRAGDAAPDDGRAMKDVNEAWRVLRAPDRRAEYDQLLRVTAEIVRDPVAHWSATATAEPASDQPYPRPLAEPGDLTVALVRAAPWVAIIVVLVAIFVFTAFARNDDQGGSELFGQCVAIEDGEVDAVPCDEPNDGRVGGIVERSSQCSRGSLAKAVSGGQWYCLRPAAEN